MNTKLYVGNLSWNTTEETLAEQFGTYGEVTEAKIIMDRDSGRSKGFAFVTFASEEAADAAITAMNEREFEGRTIRVSVAENRPRQPRQGFDRGGDRGGYSSDRGYDRGGRGNYDRGGRY
jgi:RNA recognition motif-containing protein